ncbi:hypothetical protein IMZ31_19345 (plasmid) [Pontibacillus sp. ALD_SL1]|uniref:hypothetical protein n=1 Tax=Pontibacillus sp. ALD_SL1 TaxID=2777185 RepID=UPI001A97D136|nr:hypothetical protein [Pontibacillus sp. ALD_SL1]QST02706.1 hypothetical protein IMZ31_19345 [Pontibacillus sp. ALD_SL1]
MPRTRYPKVIALPAYMYEDMKPYLMSVTEEFVAKHKEALGGLHNVTIKVEGYNREASGIYEGTQYSIRVDLVFGDDVHKTKGRDEPLKAAVFLDGIEEFSIDYSSMTPFEFFELERIYYGEGRKRDYHWILLRLIDYIGSRKPDMFDE